MKRYLIKEEKGSITTLVLFTVLMFVVILTGVYFSVTTMQKAQLKSDMRVRDIYGKDVARVDRVYNEIEKNYKIIISFTISGTEYQAEEEMTWNDWVNSSYNKDGYTISSNNILSPSGQKVCFGSSAEPTLAGDKIALYKSYNTNHSGSGAVN